MVLEPEKALIKILHFLVKISFTRTIHDDATVQNFKYLAVFVRSDIFYLLRKICTFFLRDEFVRRRFVTNES
jgi:hypothetical protein